MPKTILKVSEKFLEGFVNGLKGESVIVNEIGTFSVTQYKKKKHPSRSKGKNIGKYTFIPRKLSRISFKPDKALKNSIK